MAFGGSSSSATLPHTHNQTLVNDGGTLSDTLTDMGAVTLKSLIDGAGTSGNLELLSTTTLAAPALTIQNTSFSPVLDFDDYADFIIYLHGIGPSVDIRFSTSTGGGAHYRYRVITNTTAYTQIAGTTTYAIVSNASTTDPGHNFGIRVNYSLNSKTGGTGVVNRGWFSSNMSQENATLNADGYFNASSPTLSWIRFESSASNFATGTTMLIYGVKK